VYRYYLLQYDKNVGTVRAFPHLTQFDMLMIKSAYQHLLYHVSHVTSRFLSYSKMQLLKKMQYLSQKS